MRKLILLLLFIALPIVTNAASTVVKTYVPNPGVVGQARFKYVLWNVYDIRLYAPRGKYYPHQPYALSIYYLRSFKGKDIAERSIIEMRNQGLRNEAKARLWYNQMLAIFPNVKKGTKLTGIRKRNGQTVFYQGNRKVGTIYDREFASWFFGIWLKPNTSEPNLRRQLLNI